MSGNPNPAGVWRSTDKLLQHATYGTTKAEDIHNIQHYYAQCKDAPIATFVLLAKKNYLMKATNMPHSSETFMKRLTPYCDRVMKESGGIEIGEYGYGGILNGMYTGGILDIQYKDCDDENKWKTINVNIEQQRKEVYMESAKLDTLPTPPRDCDEWTTPHCENETMWGKRFVELSTIHNLCTFEAFKNPTFKNNENIIKSEEEFKHALYEIHSQFEEIIGSKVQIIGLFEDKECTISSDTVTPFSITKLRNAQSFDFYLVDSHLYYKIEDSFGELTGNTTQADWNPIDEPIATLDSPSFSITFGSIPEAAKEVCLKLCARERSGFKSVEDFAAGALVNIGGYRVSYKPIDHGVMKVANMPYRSDSRLLIDIHDEAIKKKYFATTQFKCNSTFPTAGRNDNPLLKSVRFVLSVFSKFVKQPDVPFLDCLTSKTVQKAKNRKASTEGIVVENEISRFINTHYSTTITGDKKVAAVVKATENKEFQGVDQLIQLDSVWVAIQYKNGEHHGKDKIESFIRTVKALRSASGIPTVGVYVSMKPMKENWSMIACEPGFNILSSATSMAVKKCVDAIREMYQ